VQDGFDAQVDATRRVESQEGLLLLTSPAREVSGATGDNASHGAGAFKAVRGQLLLPLSTEHEELRGVDPDLRCRYFVRGDQMYPSTDPHANVAALVGIEGGAIALDGAGRKNAALRDKERSAFRLRVLGLYERGDELARKVLRHVDREHDGLRFRLE
jgi:hypothetical protein